MTEQQPASQSSNAGIQLYERRFAKYRFVVTYYLASLLLLLSCGGCATARTGTELPPLLTQDELVRSYDKVAVVQVNRDRFGTAYHLEKEDYDWAHEALREEAAKIGADAVIFPEVKLEASSYLLFPATHIDARGVAIRFR